MSEPLPPSPRDDTRQRLIEVAADLLATKGPAAVTTRSVAVAAGVQAPMIYRLFGDKDGLLSAVAEHGFASYLAQKRVAVVDDDPVADLRAGWDLHVGFGLANPALFRLMHTAMQTPDGRSAVEAGADVLRNRVLRVARAGRLRVAEQRAVHLIHAAGTGVVFALIDPPEHLRDPGLADLAWVAVCAAILTDADTSRSSGPIVAAVALRAALPDLAMFTPGESGLLGEWLDRVADRSSTAG
ncbi:TetR/AcrR family transcriptional regulator [soil metagenome]